MIDINILFKKVKPITYDKGCDLYERDKTIHMEVREGFDYKYTINALVKGSGRNSYEVEIVYNSITEKIESHDCECPAHATYSGLCKHCVAVLLEFVAMEAKENGKSYDEVIEYDEDGVEYRDLDAEYDDYDETYDDYDEHEDDYDLYDDGYSNISKRNIDNPYTNSYIRNNSSYFGFEPIDNGRHTTAGFKHLFKSNQRKSIDPIIQNVAPGSIKLIPYLKNQYNGFTVEFKIGYDHMYVLKDIKEFCNNIKFGNYHEYGKKLGFIHDIEVFDKESREMIDYLLKTIDGLKNDYYYMQVNKKFAPYNIDQTVEFLKTLNGAPVNINVFGENKEYRLTDKIIPRNMTIEGVKQGIEVSVERLLGFRGEEHYIYFYNDELYVDTVERLKDINDFILAMGGVPDRRIFIEKDDVKGFCKQLLPKLQEHYKIKKINFNVSDYDIEEVEFKIYLDAPERNTVSCKVEAHYGDKKYNLYSKKATEIRDMEAEQRVNRAVSKYFNAYDEYNYELNLAHDEDRLYELLTSAIDELTEYGEVFASDKIKNINVIHKTPVKVGISVASDLLELKVDSETVSKKQLVEILTHYNPKKKYYRLKNGDFINVEHKELEVLYEMKEGLDLSGKDLLEERISLPKFRAVYLDSLMKKNHKISANRHKSFKALISNMKTVEENDFDIPNELDEILREYQKTGFLWMKTLKENGFGGILADDMGLGKTLQVITFLKSEYETKTRPTLIVCPSSLVYNWKKEFEKFATDMSVLTVTGKPEERLALLESVGPQDILVTSYDLLKRDYEAFANIEFAYQIIDEAQHIKNHNTKAAKAVKGIRAPFKLALTGTPIENRLSELWSIFDYLMPGFLYSYRRFKTSLESPIVTVGDEKATERLKQMITPFVLRRLKGDVLTDLPDKIEENVIVPITGEQRNLYDAHVVRLTDSLNNQSNEDFKTSKIKVLAELTRLRQLCCDPGLVYDDYNSESAKMDACIELIREAVDGGHKVLLFSQFTSVFELIQPRMKKEDITYYSLTGSTSKERRMELVDDFNRDDTNVFCISLKAGGTGLNLTSADIVIHFDPWWNVAAQNQATDRAHRIGQESVVNVYKLIVQNSIEEKIIKLQDKKKMLSDEVLSGDKIGAASFSKEELLEILE